MVHQAHTRTPITASASGHLLRRCPHPYTHLGSCSMCGCSVLRPPSAPQCGLHRGGRGEEVAPHTCTMTLHTDKHIERQKDKNTYEWCVSFRQRQRCKCRWGTGPSVLAKYKTHTSARAQRMPAIIATVHLAILTPAGLASAELLVSTDRTCAAADRARRHRPSETGTTSRQPAVAAAGRQRD